MRVVAFLAVEGLVTILALVLGQAADTSRAALVVVAVIFGVAAAIPISLAVALVAEKRRPHVTKHYHDNRVVNLWAYDPAIGAYVKVGQRTPAQLGEAGQGNVPAKYH